MRISDWSSDVCSSDLHAPPPAARAGLRARSMATPAPQRIEGGGMGVSGKRLGLAGLGVAVLLALAFWLGGRFGGGMSKSERSEEHTSELQSLMRISYAVFCSKTKKSTTKSCNSSNYTQPTS